MIVLSTAHAAKFPDAVEKACSVRPPLPEWLGDLGAREERVTKLPADPSKIEQFVLAASRAARGGAAL
jgi:threonine synthase